VWQAFLSLEKCASQKNPVRYVLSLQLAERDAPMKRVRLLSMEDAEAGVSRGPPIQRNMQELTLRGMLVQSAEGFANWTASAYLGATPSAVAGSYPPFTDEEIAHNNSVFGVPPFEDAGLLRIPLDAETGTYETRIDAYLAVQQCTFLLSSWKEEGYVSLAGKDTSPMPSGWAKPYLANLLDHQADLPADDYSGRRKLSLIAQASCVLDFTKNLTLLRKDVALGHFIKIVEARVFEPDVKLELMTATFINTVNHSVLFTPHRDDKDKSKHRAANLTIVVNLTPEKSSMCIAGREEAYYPASGAEHAAGSIRVFYASLHHRSGHSVPGTMKWAFGYRVPESAYHAAIASSSASASSSSEVKPEAAASSSSAPLASPPSAAAEPDPVPVPVPVPDLVPRQPVVGAHPDRTQRMTPHAMSPEEAAKARAAAQPQGGRWAKEKAGEEQKAGEDENVLPLDDGENDSSEEDQEEEDEATG
jgi:hypothetical protein